MNADIDTRMDREKSTIEAMIDLFCKGHHEPSGRCLECKELLDYALMRLESCPFQKEKPTCANCPVHCYRPEMRERIRVVMRYSGPRMLVHHPIMAARHAIDGKKSRK